MATSRPRPRGSGPCQSREGTPSMGRFTGRILAVLSIAVLASTFAFVAVAGAQEEEYPPPTTTVSGSITVPGNIVVGGTVAVSGTSCGPNQTVTIKFNGVTVATT